MKRTVIVMAFLSNLSCITKHQGEIVQANGTDLILSCKVSEYFSTQQVQLVTINLENTGPSWIGLQPSPADDDLGNVLDPAKTRAFLDAIQLQKQSDRYHRMLALQGLMLVTIAAGVSGNANALNAGLGATALYSVVTEADATLERRDQIMAGFGSDHLYGGLTQVPPELLVRRWTLLANDQQSRLKTTAFCLDGQSQEQCYRINLHRTEEVKALSIRRSALPKKSAETYSCQLSPL